MYRLKGEISCLIKIYVHADKGDVIGGGLTIP